MKRNKKLIGSKGLIKLLGLLVVLLILSGGEFDLGSCFPEEEEESDVIIKYQQVWVTKGNYDVQWYCLTGSVPVVDKPFEYLSAEFSRANKNEDDKDTSAMAINSTTGAVDIDAGAMPLFTVDTWDDEGPLVDTLLKYNKEVGLEEEGKDGHPTVYQLYIHYLGEIIDQCTTEFGGYGHDFHTDQSYHGKAVSAVAVYGINKNYSDDEGYIKTVAAHEAAHTWPMNHCIDDDCILCSGEPKLKRKTFCGEPGQELPGCADHIWQLAKNRP